MHRREGGRVLQVPTGVVTGIKWSSWGGSTATGVGSSDYVAGSEFVAEGLQEPATITAFDLGTCNGKPAYDAVEWYYPQYGQSFDANNYINDCAGTSANAYVDNGPSPAPRSVGQWDAPTITITGNSLGAVHVGMTLNQAQDASGYRFDGMGDGFDYPTTLPTGIGHLYVGLNANGNVTCVGVSGSSTSQAVTTSSGFQLDESVAQLKAVYGSQLQFDPAPTTGGMTDYAGYVVPASAGNLVFMTDPTGSTIIGVAAGTGISPNSCTG